MSVISSFQNRLASLVDLAHDARTLLVRSMIHRPRGDATGYWLQLVIAVLLATLGLALDSTAVVIGAMLVAPLMRPIVELAMGLATGSAPLVFRTGVRAVASVAVAVIASAAISWLLPFHEVTAELLARTAPSILDLFVAAACAVAGAYAVVISNSDVATTAAGTSIGISLVPPLCTAGYGLSIADWDMAIGAGLLFTANVTGIITVAGAVFVLVGFGQVDVRAEERSLDTDSDVGAATRLGRRVSGRGRLGVAPRVVLPLLLLGVIAFPLLKAVDSMSQRSRIRQHIASLMNRGNGERIVQYSLDQAARPSELRVVLVGDAAGARRMELQLRAELTKLGEPHAKVAVWAVSDASAVSALSARFDDIPLVVPAPPTPVLPPPPSFDVRVRQAWPAASAGELLAVWTSEGTPPRARVAHLGPELGPAGRELLAKSIALDATVPVIDEAALVPIEIDEARGGLGAWLPATLALIASLSNASELANLHLCITAPLPVPRGKPTALEQVARELVTKATSAHPNIQFVDGDRWRVTPQRAACPEPESQKTNVP